MGETSLGERRIESRAVAAYLGLAMGDALGATVEFMTPREIKAHHGLHDRMRGGGWLKLKRGQVTDDTTMSLALGDSILRSGRVDAMAAAHAFDAWMRTKPVDIGNTVRRGLVHFRRTGNPVAPASEHDAGNGACMRCLPVALATLGDTDENMRRACRDQAHVTHNNELSDAASECVVHMVQQAVLGANKREMLQDCVGPLTARLPEFEFAGRRQENPSGYVVETLRAVLQALNESEGFEACLVDVVNRGGDADTTGAIAGMVAGALYGGETLLSRWLKALDPTIRGNCSRQASQLLRLSPAWRRLLGPRGRDPQHAPLALQAIPDA